MIADYRASPQLRNATFEAKGPFAFLKTWEPILDDPEHQLELESITGYKELHDMGYALRVKYPQLYKFNTKMAVW